MSSAFRQLIKEVTRAGTWEAASEREMIAALEDAEDVVASLRSTLQRCVDAATELPAHTADVDTPYWDELRSAKNAAAQALLDTCSG